MGRVCSEAHDWVTSRIEEPIAAWEDQLERQCREAPCNWWCLCCNKWFCWLVWIVVKVIRWVMVTVGKWVIRSVCEGVNAVLDAVGFTVELILSIPIIGGILRAILNWVTELVWRLIGIFDYVASLAGWRPRKKMYVGAVVPMVDGVPIVPDGDVQRQVDAVVELFNRTCNIHVIFTGICHTPVPAPDAALMAECGLGGFLQSLVLPGSYFEFASATCKYTDSFRRVIGLGSEIIVFVVRGVAGSSNGCSFGSTHNYVLVEAKATDVRYVAAHEIGHACWLTHASDPQNLMFHSAPEANPTLHLAQIASIRASKHCVYL